MELDINPRICYDAPMTVHSVMHKRERLFRAVAGYAERSLLSRGTWRIELSTEQKRLARRYAREGNTLESIAKLISWSGKLPTLAKRLRDINIKPAVLHGRTHVAHRD